MMFTAGRQIAWTFILLFFAVALIVVVFYPDSRQASKIETNMFMLTTQALQQAVIYSHLKYHTLTRGKGAHLDLITVNGEGLDFNQQGYPIGIQHTSSSLKLPLTTAHCRQLWNGLMQVMQSMLAPAPKAIYETNAVNGKCVFTSIKQPEWSVQYDPATGRVSMQVIK